MTRGKQKPNHAGNEERRSFLKGAAALGGGAAASLILPSVAQAAEAAPASEHEP
ncbi:MAG TPA: twin-arginine translocation signal domain-containing protein, partial [Gammaproteobacteria bacterium]|nr:twin-arginine translocation signal domain-containing protein [Gammaproteobacteria bacterium]